MNYVKVTIRGAYNVFRYFIGVALGVGLALTGNSLADSDGTLSNAKDSEPTIIRIAMVHALDQVNARDARVAIDLNWTRHLANVFPNVDSQFEILPNVAAAVDRIEGNRLHGLSLGITQYMQLKEHTAIRPIFISSRQVQPLESYVLLVRKGVDWQGLIRQPQKRLMIEKMATPTIGRMWLETVLQDKQLPGGHAFFSKISFADKPARIILPVFFGQAEVCLVPESLYQTMVELNPQISQRLTILERSPGFIKTIHCVTPLLPENMVTRFLDKGMQMADTIDGRQLLLIFQVKKNFLFQESYITNSEQVYQKYRRLVGGR